MFTQGALKLVVSGHRRAEPGFESSARKEQSSWAAVAIPMCWISPACLPSHPGQPTVEQCSVGFPAAAYSQVCSLPQHCWDRNCRSCSSCCSKGAVPVSASVSVKAATSKLFPSPPLQGTELISILFALGGCFTDEKEDKVYFLMPPSWTGPLLRVLWSKFPARSWPVLCQCLHLGVSEELLIPVPHPFWLDSIFPKGKNILQSRAQCHTAQEPNPQEAKQQHGQQSCAWLVAQHWALVPFPVFLSPSMNLYLSCEEQDGVMFSHRSGEQWSQSAEAITWVRFPEMTSL